MPYRKPCEWCSGTYEAKLSTSRFCSDACRAANRRSGGVRNTPNGAVSASKPPQRPSKPPVEYSDTLVEGVAELRSQCESEGLISPIVDQKLRRMHAIAVSLDEQPNQPSMYAAYLQLERDVERILPSRVSNEFNEIMRELWTEAYPAGNYPPHVPAEFRQPPTDNEETT